MQSVRRRLAFGPDIARGAIARGAAWLFAGRIGAQGLSVIFTVVLARRLGVGGFGEYAYVAAIVYVANVATTFGTDMILIRDVASGAVARWQAAVAIQFGLSALAIVGVWTVAPVLPGLDPVGAVALRIYVLALVPAAVYSVATAILRGRRRMRGYALLGTASAGVQVGMLVALGVGGGRWLTLPGIAAGLVVAQAIAAFAAWLMCGRAFTNQTGEARRGRRLRADVFAMLAASAPVGAVGWLGMFYQRLPVLVLAAFSGSLATGWFAGATRIVEASKTGHVALLGAIYPAMANARSDARAEARVQPRTEPRVETRPEARVEAGGRMRTSEAAADLDWWRRAYLGAGLLLSAVLVIAGPTLVDVFYGATFAPTSGALTVLALTVVPSTWSTFLSLELVASHRQIGALRAQGLTLAALIGLIAALVPTLGWTGGAWAVLGAEGVQLAALLHERRRAREPRTDIEQRAIHGDRPARVASRVTGPAAPNRAGGGVG